MVIREHEPLSRLTTFRIGGPARYVLVVEDIRELPEAIEFARRNGGRFRVLGAGSNMLADDAGYDGVVVRIAADAVTLSEDGDTFVLTAEAGAMWDDLVRRACGVGAWGIENLAGIPGTAGAAPVQNIGAYGADLADTLESVDTFDAQTGDTARLSRAECRLGYRTSRFKEEPHRIITRITLRLSRSPAPRLSYKDLAARAAAGDALDTPARIADVVRAIRAKKFPDLEAVGTAGSFFKNPLVSRAEYARLAARYEGLPGFPDGERVKLPLAWILDAVLHARGRRVGKTRLFEAQPLVIVAEQGATSHEVRTLAESVADDVRAATGIAIEWEAQKI